MASSVLVGLDLEQGSKAVEVLESNGLKINVALWLLSDRYSDWRLVVASRALDQQSSSKAYGTLIEILRKAGIGFDLRSAIWAMDINEPFIKGLRKSFSKTEGVYGMRLGGQSFGDLYVIDAFVYKIV